MTSTSRVIRQTKDTLKGLMNSSRQGEIALSEEEFQHSHFSVYHKMGSSKMGIIAAYDDSPVEEHLPAHCVILINFQTLKDEGLYRASKVGKLKEVDKEAFDFFEAERDAEGVATPRGMIIHSAISRHTSLSEL
jgi:hypothetical protein